MLPLLPPHPVVSDDEMTTLPPPAAVSLLPPLHIDKLPPPEGNGTLVVNVIKQYPGEQQIQRAVKLNVPGKHLSHASCFGWSLYVPALQLVASSLPTGQKVPVGHVRQSSTLVITVSDALRRVPPGQGNGADAPSGQ